MSEQSVVFIPAKEVHVTDVACVSMSITLHTNSVFFKPYINKPKENFSLKDASILRDGFFIVIGKQSDGDKIR